jgi:membrane protein DedA with SNARE-associated domain
MHFTNEPIFQWFAQYAYEPYMVYLGVILFMTASSFGLPIPEEVTIISVGILSYMGTHTEAFPPPYPGAPVVSGIHAAILTTCAVFFSDLTVFTLGRTGGRRVMTWPLFKRFFNEKTVGFVNKFFTRYGMFATFIFRFTPGVRFPAHVLLGMSPLKLWKFMIVDGFAVLISVPTQILLIYYYGEPILQAMYQVKGYLFGGIGLVVVALFAHKLSQRYKAVSTAK